MKSVRINGEKSLSHQAYISIKEKIVKGELKQGEMISISALAEELGISRTPVTLACQKLEYDRFLTIAPKLGVMINSVTIDDAREIYELRTAIETYAAKHAFYHFTSEDIAFLRRSNQVQREAMERGSPYDFMVEDTTFHKYLLSKYKNTQLFSILDNLYDRAFLLGIKCCSNPMRMRSSLVEHDRIIEALGQRDKQKFIDAVEHNIINGYTSLTGSYGLSWTE